LQGKVMEKMLTTSVADFERFRKSAPAEAVSQEERTQREAYNYRKVRDTKNWPLYVELTAGRAAISRAARFSCARSSTVTTPDCRAAASLTLRRVRRRAYALTSKTMRSVEREHQWTTMSGR
jgi:hypothetical protein